MLMIGKQLTAEQRVTKAVVDILGNPKYIALAGVLMVGNRTFYNKTSTACTNGRDERYGRAFVDSPNEAELRFVVLHECYHKLYRHLTTWRHLWKEDHGRANRACDHVINIKILDDNKDKFVTMPKTPDGKPLGMYDEKYRGMDSAQVYKLLASEPEDEGGEEGDDEDEGGGMDEHDWEGAESLSDEEKKELERDIDEAVRQGALAAGKWGIEVDRDLKQLLQPKVDWREALREFLSTTCKGNDFSTWSRPNRRFISSGHYLPSGVSQRIGDVVIGVDTSGSIGANDLAKFLTEVKSICDTIQPEKIHLLYWDTSVRAHETYNAETSDGLVASTKPKGGGGTDASCVPKYLSKHGINPTAVVMLTDGYIENWGTWSHPVLWCVIDGTEKYAPVGTTLHVQWDN